MNILSMVHSAKRRDVLAACAGVLALFGCGGGGDDGKAVAAAESGRSQKLSVTTLTSLPNYTVTNLGSRGFVSPKGINATGQVAGYSYFAGSNQKHAFFFDGASMLDLGTSGGVSSEAVALNDSGQVTGSIQTVANGLNSSAAFSWTASGGMVTIQPSASYSVATWINSAGTIGGYYGSDGFYWTRSGGVVTLALLGPWAVNSIGQMVGATGYSAGTAAIRQPDGTQTPLVAPSRGAVMGAQYINDAGLVAAYADRADGSPGGVFAWQAGTLYDVDAALRMSPLDQSIPSGLNRAGQIIGTNKVNSPDYSTAGFIWSRTEGANYLGYLDSSSVNYRTTYPRAINDSGQVIGTSYGPLVPFTAFTWTAATGIVDLNTKLVNAPAGIHLDSALAISDNGWIVATGNTGLVLLKPEGVAPPAPAAPTLGLITANDPVAFGTTIDVAVTFGDVNLSDTHTAQWRWGDSTPPSAGAVTESAGEGSVSGTHVFTAAGVYTVGVTLTDSTGLSTTVARDVVVYDAQGGSVSGRGSISSPMGAYKADTTLMGPASFAFVSKYKRGATIPTGSTEFQFKSAALDFRSNAYERLVVAGARAQYKGVGAFNGKADYKFMITAVDGALLGNGTPDRFRIKIWHFDAVLNADVVDYDNQIDSSLEGGNREGTAIASGSIMIRN